LGYLNKQLLNFYGEENMKLFFLKFSKYSVLLLAILSLIITLVVFFSDNGNILAGILMGVVTFYLSKYFINLKEKVSEFDETEKNRKYNEYTVQLSERYGPGKEKEIQDWIKQFLPSSDHEIAAQILQDVEKKYKEEKEREAQRLKEEKEREAQRLKEEKEREALLEKYRAEYGDEIVESYQKRVIMFGMPQQMIHDIYGEPVEIKKEMTERTLSETYYYAKDGVKYEDGKTSTYKIKVDFKNAIVKGYKEY
jgi:hypothetical protein